jgi:hypothetical protein
MSRIPTLQNWRSYLEKLAADRFGDASKVLDLDLLIALPLDLPGDSSSFLVGATVRNVSFASS